MKFQYKWKVNQSEIIYATLLIVVTVILSISIANTYFFLNPPLSPLLAMGCTDTSTCKIELSTWKRSEPFMLFIFFSAHFFHRFLLLQDRPAWCIFWFIAGVLRLWDYRRYEDIVPVCTVRAHVHPCKFFFQALFHFFFRPHFISLRSLRAASSVRPSCTVPEEVLCRCPDIYLST